VDILQLNHTSKSIFPQLYRAKRIYPSQELDISRIFVTLDKNNEGKMQHAELEKLISSLKPENLTDDRIKNNSFKADFLKWLIEINIMSRSDTNVWQMKQQWQKYNSAAMKRRHMYLTGRYNNGEQLAREEKEELAT
jgi:hypothetical protein